MGPILRLALFRLPDFRRLAASILGNSVGMMGETVVLGWLTLELTNSPFLVGVAMGMRALPLFFVGVPAGALADRFPRHRLLMVTGAGQALTASTLGVLTLVGVVSLTHVLLLTLAAGTLRGLEHAARQGYTHDVVGGAALVPGMAVLGVAMRAGWLVGSLGVGAIIALNAARSIGGMVGLAAASTRRGGGAFFVGVVVAFGASLIVLALAPHVVGFAGVVAVLVVVNAMGALADLLAQSLLQLSAPAHLRGRAGGAWVVAIGLAPLGQLQIGALASLFGVSVAFGTSGLALVALAGATALLFPRDRKSTRLNSSHGYI